MQHLSRSETLRASCIVPTQRRDRNRRSGSQESDALATLTYPDIIKCRVIDLEGGEENLNLVLGGSSVLSRRFEAVEEDEPVESVGSRLFVEP